MCAKITYKKHLSSLLLTFLVVLNALPIFAATNTRVFDQAGLFTTAKITSFEHTIDYIQSNYSIDVAIVTTNDAQGKSSMAYADNFYDDHGIGYGNAKDGVLLLIDMDNREAYISTSGIMIKYLTDSRINTMLDHLMPSLGGQDYSHAAECFLYDTKVYLNEGIPENQKTVYGDFVSKPDGVVASNTTNTPSTQNTSTNREPIERKPFTNQYGEPLNSVPMLPNVGMAAAIALVISLIIRGCIIHRYKHPRHTVPATTANQSSVYYTERSDRFVTSHTSRTRVQSNSNSSSSSHSSGRSSVHRSSSGRTHGGGGRKF